jgi:hypothetical protein
MTPRAVLSTLATAALLGGCVKPSATVEIYQACAPPAPTAEGCIYPTGTCSLSPLDTYTMDVDVTSSMFLAVEVHNQLADNANPSTGAANTHNAFVNHYSVGFSASLPGTSGDIENAVASNGSSVVGVRLIDSDTWQALYNQLHGTNDTVRMTANLKLSGVWGDQSHFETAPRKFGIEVCAGCFVAPTCTTGTLAFCPGPGVWPASSACL